MFVQHRCGYFDMPTTDIPADGVISGFGKVHGRTVYAYAQDFTARGGTLGEMHAKKITKVMDLAMKAGAPCVGLNDSGGARIQEGIDALFGFGEIFFLKLCGLGRYPTDHLHHGPHGRRRGVLTCHDRLYLHGEKFKLHVYNRPRSHQVGHRRGNRP